VSKNNTRLFTVTSENVERSVKVSCWISRETNVYVSVLEVFTLLAFVMPSLVYGVIASRLAGKKSLQNVDILRRMRRETSINQSINQ